MVSKLLLFICAVPLLAQNPAVVQDTLKSARAAAHSGNFEQARTGLQSAFSLAVANDPMLAVGIALELSGLLEENQHASDAAVFLSQSAAQLQASGGPIDLAVPIANRLAHVARTLTTESHTAEAREALAASLDILRRTYGPNAPCIPTVLNQLASADRALGQNALAADESSQAASITAMNQTPTFAQARKISAGVVPPRVTSKVDPEYAPQARAAHLAGTVLLSVVVSPDGIADDIQISMPLGLGLDEKAIDAVRQWRFAPATAKADGQAVPVRANIEVNFRLL